MATKTTRTRKGRTQSQSNRKPATPAAAKKAKKAKKGKKATVLVIERERDYGLSDFLGTAIQVGVIAFIGKMLFGGK